MALYGLYRCMWCMQICRYECMYCINSPIQYHHLSCLDACMHLWMQKWMHVCMGLCARLSECMETIRNPYAGILILQFASAYAVRICVSYWYEPCSADFLSDLLMSEGIGGSSTEFFSRSIQRVFLQFIPHALLVIFQKLKALVIFLRPIRPGWIE